MSRPSPELVRLEWALDELHGASTPPDLTQTVLARWRAGDVPELPTAPSHPTRWLPAAAMLLAATVLATWVG